MLVVVHAWTFIDYSLTSGLFVFVVEIVFCDFFFEFVLFEIDCFFGVLESF